MKLNHLVSSFIFNKTKNIFFKTKSLRIINIHHIPEMYFEKLKANIIFLKKNFEILDPEAYFDIIKKNREIKRN